MEVENKKRGFFSDNVVFFDTEFTDFNIQKGELLSIGMVKNNLNGKEEQLYLELDYQGEVHPWVKKKVLPYLNGKKMNREQAVQKIKKFIGKDKPFLMSYVNQFDAIYWYQLFGSPKEHPAYWIPIDFASILFACGFDPWSLNKEKFFSMIGVDKNKYQAHNSLEDAKMLKEIYHKFVLYLNKN